MILIKPAEAAPPLFICALACARAVAKDARFEVCTFPDYDCSGGFDGIVASRIFAPIEVAERSNWFTSE